MGKTLATTIKVDATEISATVSELSALLAQMGRLHPYYDEVVAPIFNDPSRFIEVTIDRGQMFLRPTPEALAALASLRAARGVVQPDAWIPRPSESA
jgi:hypothetical protein